MTWRCWLTILLVLGGSCTVLCQDQDDTTTITTAETHDAFYQSDELLDVIEQVSAGKMVLDDEEWEELLDHFPDESPLQLLALTCRECRQSASSVTLDTDERYQQFDVPFGAVTIHLHLLPINRSHHVFVNDECVFNATQYEIDQHVRNTRIGDIELPANHRLLLQSHMDVVVKVASYDLQTLLDIYWIELDREIEPPCGWMIRTQSQYQNISIYKGDQEEQSVARSPSECYRHLNAEQRFTLPWQCPHLDNYQMILSGVIQTDTAEEQSHGVMVRWPLMYAKELRNILIIGGGDAQAAKEFLKFPHLLRNVEHFVNVELDGTLVDLWTNHPLTRHLSNNAYLDPRLEVVVGDGIGYLVHSSITWDIIIDDCEVQVSKQPDSFKRLYKLYERALVDKLAPGGVAQIMTPIDWETTDQFQTSFDLNDMTNRQRMIFMRRMSVKLEEARPWLQVANYVMSQVAYANSVGAEHFIFFSSTPFIKRRHVPPPPGLEHPIGGWSERPLFNPETVTVDLFGVDSSGDDDDDDDDDDGGDDDDDGQVDVPAGTLATDTHHTSSDDATTAAVGQ